MGLSNRRVAAVVYDGLCTFEFGLATELFGLARPELGVEWYDFSVVSVDPGPLRTVGGLMLEAPTDLSVIAEAGTVVLPGWRHPDDKPPALLVEALVEAHGRGARIMSICSGVFVLAATGLLDGKPATTHWRYTEQLAAMYPRIVVQPEVLYIDNETTLTSAGSAAGLDLGLHLIRRDYGAAIANRVAKRLVVPTLRDGGQAQFIDRPRSQPDQSPLGELTEWALNRLHKPLTVDDLAQKAAMAPRTLARRFAQEFGTSPHRWLVHRRVDLARQLLEETDRSIDLIAEQSGFGSAANLRHHFSRLTHTNPTAYRRSFRQSAIAPNG